MGDTFPTPTDLNYLTKHITLKTIHFTTIERSLSMLFTTGILTRVYSLRIKELNLP